MCLAQSLGGHADWQYLATRMDVSPQVQDLGALGRATLGNTPKAGRSHSPAASNLGTSFLPQVPSWVPGLCHPMLPSLV